MSDESRIEKQLEKLNNSITGGDEKVETEEPQSRIEELLENINKSVEGGIGGATPDWSVDDSATAGYIANNARTLDWSGNEVLAGKLTVGADPTDDMDAATKKYVDENAGSGNAATPDWSVEDSTADGYIANKPAIKAGSAENSIIEGSSENTASGNFAHGEGSKCTASGICSHAEGVSTLSSGYYSHSEGAFSQASGNYSHSEGNNTKAKGSCSHVEGAYSTASGENSHAEGTRTVATGNSSHVCGRFNIEDTENKYAEIVGNGTVAVNGRSNARTLDWEGNEVLAGKLTVGAAPTEDLDVATKKYVDDLIADLQAKIDALTQTTS